MKKSKLHEVIPVQTKKDLIKMNERIGYHLRAGKKVSVNIENGYVHITEQKAKKNAS
jgi:hypothetical protein